MQFSPADITAMIDAMGQPVTVGLAQTTAVFNTGPREVARNGMTVYTDTPTLLVSVAVGDLVEKNLTIITVDDVDYQAFEKVPDGSGFVELDLTRDF
jgi:hypothetical protein